MSETGQVSDARKAESKDSSRCEQLVHQIADGNPQALDELYQLLAPAIMAQVHFMGAEPATSEEVLQDTMLAVWNGAAMFRGDASVRSWVIAIARRQARDRFRRRQMLVVDQDDLVMRASEDPSPELIALDRAEVAEVAQAVQLLQPAHQEVLGLAFGAGLALAEIAEILEVPIGTVKSRLYAARIALARALIEKGAR